MELDRTKHSFDQYILQLVWVFSIAAFGSKYYFDPFEIRRQNVIVLEF